VNAFVFFTLDYKIEFLSKSIILVIKIIFVYRILRFADKFTAKKLLRADNSSRGNPA